MFAKSLVTKSIIDAVNSVLEEEKKELLLEPKKKEIDETGFHKAAHAARKAGQSHFEFQGKKYPVTVKSYKEAMEMDEASLKIPTATGTKVLGGSGYGSKKAHEVQHKNPFEKGPTKKDLKGIKAPSKKELKNIGEDSFAARLLNSLNENKATGTEPIFTDNNIGEAEMTDAQMKKREKIVMSMKKGMAGFKQRYGKNWKNVMYATATKQAMKEDSSDTWNGSYDFVLNEKEEVEELDEYTTKFNDKNSFNKPLIHRIPKPNSNRDDKPPVGAHINYGSKIPGLDKVKKEEVEQLDEMDPVTMAAMGAAGGYLASKAYDGVKSLFSKKVIPHTAKRVNSMKKTASAYKNKNEEVEIEEGMMDKVRAANYDRLSKRSYKQADKTKPGGVSVYDANKMKKGDDRAEKAAKLRGEEIEIDEADTAYKKEMPIKKMSDVVDRKKTVKDLMKGRKYFGTGKVKEEVEELQEEQHKEILVHTEVEDGMHQDKLDTQELHNRIKAAAKEHNGKITYQDKPSLHGGHTIGATGPNEMLKKIKSIASDYEHLGAKHEISESSEQIDELSKKTQASYARKAMQDLAKTTHLRSALQQQKMQGTMHPDHEKEKTIDTLGKSSINRQKGLHRVMDRLAKEEVELSEKNDSHTHAAHYENDKGEWTGMKLFTAKDDQDAIRQAHQNCEDGCRLSKVERHTTVKEAVDVATDKSAHKITTDMLRGREPGGKLNSFKNFKTNLTIDGEEDIPKEIEQGEDTKEKQKITTNPGPVDIKFDDKLTGPTPYTHFSSQEKITSEEVRGESKKIRNREYKERDKEVEDFNKKVVQKEEVELDESAKLDQYLMSRGLNPKFLSRDAKIAHSKSRQFLSWLSNHQMEETDPPFDKPYKTVKEPVITDKSGAKHTPMSQAKHLARQALKKIKKETMMGKISGGI